MTVISPVKLNAVFFKEWMNATLFVKETDTLFETRNGCKLSGEINKLPLKKSQV